MKYLQHLKESEDSGISSLRSQCELSAIEKCGNVFSNQFKEDLNGSCSNMSKR